MNPFKYGKIVENDAFCNRDEELSILKNRIQNGQSVWLYSPRRYGKTSLLLKAFNEIESVKTVYFDFYNVLSLSDFLDQYSKLISKKLFDWKEDARNLMTSIRQYFKGFSPQINIDEFGNQSFTFNFSQEKLEKDITHILSIPEEIAKKNKLKVCIAFDEFQEYERIDSFLINHMRSVFQKHQNVSYVFMGSKQSLMNSIFTDTKSPFYEFGEKMIIDPISFEDWHQFISEKFQNTKLQLGKNTIDEILKMSNGHPHFTQYFSSVVWNIINAGGDPNSDNFTQNWIGQIINSQSDIFQNIMDQLTNNQRKILKVIAEDEYVSLFAKETAMKHNFPAGSTLTVAINGLVKKDLIIKKEKRYIIVNPVFREWLKLL